MKNDNPEQSGKKTLTRVLTAHTATAVFLFVLTIFLLLQAHDLRADSGSGMINRAPLIKEVAEPTELEKLSNSLDNIIKSINEIPEEEEATILIAVPEKPAEKPAEKETAPVIAKPIITEPVKTKEAKAKPVEKKPQPIVAKTVTPEPVTTAPVQMQAAKTEPVIEPVKTIDKPTDYLKVSAEGQSLTNDAEQWSCTEDAKNGLLWEVKSDNDDLRDKDYLYSWFDPSQTGGIADGGLCKGDIACDTNAYVEAINKLKLCGHNDWRLPTREEMQSLVYFDNKKTDTRINSNYFPETLASWYWTASSNKDNPDYAWYVLFRNGISLNDLKARPKHIRLVRKNNEA